MQTNNNSGLKRLAATVGLLGTLLCAPAMAASYNIILKNSGGGVQSCAAGGFTFTKSTSTGSFPATSPSVQINGTAQAVCLGVNAAKTLNAGSLSVNVANVTLNNQNQGPNVVSINGSLSSGNGSNHFTINFLANKTYTVNQNTGQNPQVASGVYHVFNAANAVPEPETLWLALVGLSALVLSRRVRRR